MSSNLNITDRFNDDDISRHWEITKKIWHRELIRIARIRCTDWKYVADFGCSWTGLQEMLWDNELYPISPPILGLGIDTCIASIVKCQNRVAESRLPILYMGARLDDLIYFSQFKFDIIFCWEVFYLLDDFEMDRAISIMKSLLRENGILICGTICYRSINDNVMNAYSLPLSQKIFPFKPYWRLESDDICFFEKHGFTVEKELIRIGSKEYAEKIKHLPPDMFCFSDDAHRSTFYTEYGKSVWICNTSVRQT